MSHLTLSAAATKNNGGQYNEQIKQKIHDETSGLDYILVGNYYIPAIELLESDDRSIGKWGRMHKAYLKETNPLLINHLILTDKLNSYLADLNEPVQNHCQLIIKPIAATEGVTKALKRWSQWEWIKTMNSIVSRTEEIIKSEIINA